VRLETTLTAAALLVGWSETKHTANLTQLVRGGSNLHCTWLQTTWSNAPSEPNPESLGQNPTLKKTPYATTQGRVRVNRLAFGGALKQDSFHHE